ncbi:ABC transporter permease [Cellulomonas alba]|uniref:ABC transporter permease n=1 Tax=Cellulomonas alba TaxID=3053467 RepID=A0ABT7SER6_9CELL|nr:ABC transporter permease [Cellulomonas alba]MDM7854683.1 ABC transporter permease [Cellulomonas alba]
MTTVELDEHPVAVPPAHPGHWHVTWHGVRTVAALELRQRVRSTRWVVALVAWFVVVGGLTLLISGALSAVDDGADRQRGALLFAAVTFLVLGLGLLVTPTLASTSINGDRAAGTLATLQVTLLTPAEIALGKVLAAWTASCAFLLASVPFLGFAAAVGPTPWWSVLRVVVLVAVLLAAVCGMGLGFSALVARPAGSTVLTFVTVAALVLGTPLLFGVTYPSVEQTESVQVRVQRTDDVTGNPTTCELTTQQRSVAHTERTWWLLALNPFVVMADGAGTSSSLDQAEARNDPLGVLREGVRLARTGASATIDECWGVDGGRVEPTADAPIWPWGLGVNLLLGAAGFVVAVRRLSLPQGKLARGTRVA